MTKCARVAVALLIASLTACAAQAPQTRAVQTPAVEPGVVPASSPTKTAQSLPFRLTAKERRWLQGLDNAATRDRAISRLMVEYMMLLRSAFGALRSGGALRGSAGGGSAAVARFYQRRGGDFARLGRRAALMTSHLDVLKDKWSRPGKLTSARASRIESYRQIFDCIDRDGAVRGSGGVRGEGKLRPMGGYREEFARMRLSMRCSALISRTRKMR